MSENHGPRQAPLQALQIIGRAGPLDDHERSARRGERKTERQPNRRRFVQ